MVDAPRLDEMLTRLRIYQAVLQGMANLPRDRFLADPDKVGNAKYHFVVAIETCLSIANHIIVSEQYRIPSDNADAFAALREAGVVSAELGERLGAMTRFRNRLVHLYWKVDDDRVHGYLETSLPDLESFRQAVAAKFR